MGGVASRCMRFNRLLSALGLALPYRWGHDFFLDIKYRLPREKIAVAFDVGANVGQSVSAIRRHFPDCNVYCFEPDPASFAEIPTKNKFQMALGSRKSMGSLDKSLGSSDRYRVVEGDSFEVDTVDHFCFAHGVENIDFLKIDTEGNDLEVIKGASDLLRSSAIDIVQAEVSMNLRNTLHVQFNDVHQTLEKIGYFLFGIYEQVHEWPTREPHLRRANVVYISSKVIERNRHT